ncbi:MAG: hypothetical protein QXD43_02430 [Candidatus Aenigmatarchaeota archaeon]
MKGLYGVIPAIGIIAILAALGVGVGTPVALAELQHRNVTNFVPEDLPYGIMRAGENIMALYQLNKSQWNNELIRVRERERTQLQIKCPNCTQQIRELEQEMNRIREQERIRQQTEIQQGYGSETETQQSRQQSR